MVPKWFKFTQKPKNTAATVPNVYLSPDECRLIVTPELDIPISSHTYPFTNIHVNPESPLHDPSSRVVLNSSSYDQNFFYSPISEVRRSPTTYHYVLSRHVSATTHQRPVPFNHNNSLYNSAYSSVSRPDITSSSSNTVFRPPSKLRKPRPRTRSLHATTTRIPPVPSAPLDTLPTSRIQSSCPSAPAPAPLDTDPKVSNHSPVSPAPPSPSTSALAPSTSSHVALLHPALSSTRGTTRRGASPARKLTKRKRPRSRSTTSPDYNKLPSYNTSNMAGNSNTGAHGDSSPIPVARDATPPPPRAESSRSRNASVPDLPTSVSLTHGRYSPAPGSRAGSPQDVVGLAKREISPSPQRGRTNASPAIDHTEFSGVTNQPRRRRSMSETRRQVARTGTENEDFDNLQSTHTNGKSNATVSISRTETALSTLSVSGVRSIGGTKSAWLSTWSVDETSSYSAGKDCPGASVSTSVVNNSYAFIRPPTSWPTRASDSLRRPRLLRRNAAEIPQRRWTLAMAVTDEGITDEALVEQLERLRSEGKGEKVDKDNVYGGPQAQLRHARRSLSRQRDIPSPTLPTVSVPDDPVWQTARCALLTCRELVRTERHYLAQMRVLLSGGTATAPPALMLTYVPDLVRASAALLGLMEADPSAWGVAAAFVGSEEALECAFVGWCGIVGGFFVGRAEDVGLGRTGSESKRESEKRRPRSGVMWRGSHMNVKAHRRNSMSAVGVSASVVLPRLLTRNRSNMKERDGQHAVRDLAILPTQRLMRYVLLYRNLLDHTPVTSPSRGLVEQAVEAAQRIANKCDRAQGNAEILLRG